MAPVLIVLTLLAVLACGGTPAAKLPPVSLDPRPRAAHDLPGASIDLLVEPTYQVGTPVEVEVEIWTWDGTVRGPLAAEVRAGAQPEAREIIRRWHPQVEREIPTSEHGRLVVVWDGRDAAGQVAPAGSYWIALVFEVARPGQHAAREEVGSSLRLTRP